LGDPKPARVLQGAYHFIVTKSILGGTNFRIIRRWKWPTKSLLSKHYTIALSSSKSAIYQVLCNAIIEKKIIIAFNGKNL
jgi:hypothetical protein